MDAEELLVKVNSGGKLKPAEFEEIVQLLETVEVREIGRKLSVDDIYALLLVIGKSKNITYRPLLEKYLDAEDALTVSMLLEILCLKWGPMSEYLERLISFALGNTWDTEEDLRQIAIKILGEYLYEEIGKRRAKITAKSKIDPRAGRIIELLLSTLQDEQGMSSTRQTAYYSLCRAYGKPWEEIPSEYARLNLTPESPDIDWTAVDYLRSLASSCPSSEVSESFDSSTGIR